MDDDVQIIDVSRKRSFAGGLDAPSSSKLARTSVSSLRAARGGSLPALSPHIFSDALPPSISPSVSQSSQINPRMGLVLNRLATLESTIDRSYGEHKERIREIRDLCEEMSKK
jgi:hypothetical protein